MIDSGKFLQGHVNFAADFQKLGRVLGPKPQRDAADGAQVMRDVVAALAVAARGAERELALFVGEGDGDAVELELDHVFDGFAWKQLAHASIEFAQLAGVVGIVDREHRHAMRDRCETFDRLPADALRWAGWDC